jgi:hypothetical protein
VVSAGGMAEQRRCLRGRVRARQSHRKVPVGEFPPGQSSRTNRVLAASGAPRACARAPPGRATSAARCGAARCFRARGASAVRRGAMQRDEEAPPLHRSACAWKRRRAERRAPLPRRERCALCAPHGQSRLRAQRAAARPARRAARWVAAALRTETETQPVGARGRRTRAPPATRWRTRTRARVQAQRTHLGCRCTAARSTRLRVFWIVNQAPGEPRLRRTRRRSALKRTTECDVHVRAGGADACCVHARSTRSPAHNASHP